MPKSFFSFSMTTLFDELHAQDLSVINLSVDTIDPFLLGGCKDAFELATMHSMVSFQNQYLILEKF